MQAINITSVIANTTAALAAGDSLFTHCVALQRDFVGCDRDTVKATLLPIVVDYQKTQPVIGADGLPLVINGKIVLQDVDTKTQGSGRIVMTGDKTAVNTATRKLNRLIDAIVAKPDNAKEEIEVPADVLAAAAAFWALCAEYEGAGKLAATAMAMVKAG
tara:strand:+ start:358 stop:837 length:480 start_codon:yes stop_codon:yes gene_type:complete